MSSRYGQNPYAPQFGGYEQNAQSGYEQYPQEKGYQLRDSYEQGLGYEQYPQEYQQMPQERGLQRGYQPMPQERDYQTPQGLSSYQQNPQAAQYPNAMYQQPMKGMPPARGFPQAQAFQAPMYPNAQQERAAKIRPDLYQIFARWDKDHSGSIDQYELTEALREMGEDCSPSTVQAMIDTYDTDGNGTIELDEFEDLYTYIQQIHGAFNKGISGMGGMPGTQEITMEKAENILKGIHGPALIGAPAMFYSLWKIYDKRGTGKIGWKSFLLLALSLKALAVGYKPSKPATRAAPVPQGQPQGQPQTQNPLKKGKLSKLGKMFNLQKLSNIGNLVELGLDLGTRLGT